MSGMTMAPLRATAQPAQLDPTQATNAALATANARIQTVVPALGANPLQRLMDMVSDAKFVEIIRIANRNTGKSSRTVGGVSVGMEPAPASDNNLPLALRPMVLKLRTLAAWLVLARLAPAALARATAQYLVTRGAWSPAKFSATMATLFARAGTVATTAAADAARAAANLAKAAYVKAIDEWHKLQPRVIGGPQNGQLVTSGPQYNLWMAAKPPAPPGINALAGLSGSRLKRAYRAMHGLGDGEDFSSSPEPMQDEGSGDPNTVYDPSVGAGAAGDAGTTEPTNAAQGPAGIAIPPVIMGLLAQLLAIGGTTLAQGGMNILTGGQGVKYTYAPNGVSTPPGHDLPLPLPEGQEYAPDGSRRSIDAGPLGIPLWGWLLGAGLGVAAYKRKW